MKLSKVLTLAALIGCAAAGSIAPAPASAKDYPVTQLVWKNNGAYKARVHLKWKDATGKTRQLKDACRIEGGHGVASDGGQYVYDGQTARCGVTERDSVDIPTGSEVWLVIEISSGETESCRKDGTRFVASPETNQSPTANFSSGGTTLNNNRCKFRGYDG